MVTYQRELPLQMIRERPQLAIEILRDAFDIDAPAHDQVIAASENKNTLYPAELHCDGTVLANESGKAVFGVVVESQRRTDEEKLYSWPAYVATFRHQHKCPTALLVICPDKKTAEECSAPIVLGPPGSIVHPLVVAPQDLLPITDPEEALRWPERAILTAPFHADGQDFEAVLNSYSAAIRGFDREIGHLYHDYCLSLFSDAAVKYLEDTMKVEDYEWQSDYSKKLLSEGEARAILIVLRSRRLEVSDEARQRIMSCTDLEELERWLNLASVVNSTEQLFD